MSSHDKIIPALEAALAQDPENFPLRLHLADILVKAEKGQDALQHCIHVLNSEPDNLEALRIAVTAATQSGDLDRAERYRRLFIALGGSESPSDEQKPSPPSQPHAPNHQEDSKNSRKSDQGTSDPEQFSRLTVGADGAIDGDLPDFIPYVEKADVRLEDVAGMEQVKRRLELALFAPLRDPRIREMYGKTLRGGLMMYGPPGCGKTFLARAVAGELGAQFVNVGLADVLDMWLGQSEQNLHNIFEYARQHTPCVIFFDEIDALGRKRSLRRDSGGRDVINQLLSELDGHDSDRNEGVFVLAATNHPWDVDSALRRPGRFDRTLIVLPPDPEARQQILKLNTRNKPIDDDIDFGKIASQTQGFSGADLAHLCDSAAELAIEDSLKTGRPRPISKTDFKKALKDIRSGSTKSWFETARNYAMFSNEGGMYDDLLDYLRANRMM